MALGECVILHAQESAYAAFVDTGDLSICSVSPELFFALDGATLTSRPMKGTAITSAAITINIPRFAHCSAATLTVSRRTT